MKKFKAGKSISPWSKFLFYMAMFYMQCKGREKAAKVVEFVAKWLKLCLSTVALLKVPLKFYVQSRPQTIVCTADALFPKMMRQVFVKINWR